MKKLWMLLLTLVFTVCLISPAAVTEVYAADGIAMTVNGTEYTDHGTGWSSAVKLARGGTKVTVKLFADWVADAENGFACPDGGTKDGALYVGGGEFVLDLNGYTLDRNAPKDKFYSSVLYIEDCTFTLDDTSEAKTGTITGGFAQRGGGIYAEDCELTINDGNISKNKAEDGGGVYTYDAEGFMNGGSITDNEAIDCGGGIHIYDENVLNINADVFNINDGVIARNRAGYNGGAVAVYGELVINKGIIEENYAGNEGGGIYIARASSLEMYGGIIRKNTSLYHGGGIACHVFSRGKPPEYAYLAINCGSIIENVSLTGNGGGISWNEAANLRLTDCTITGNCAPKGYGGGVYFPKSGVRACFAGTVIVTGNTALTDRPDNVSNFFVEDESELSIYQGTASLQNFGNLNPNSKIGLSFGVVDLSEKTQLTYETAVYDADLTSQMADCFFSDDTRYLVTKEQHGDHYDIYLAKNSDHTFTGAPLFTVETADEGKKDFFDRTEGWDYVLEKSKTVDVKLTLLSDWIGGGGYFSYYETGTYEGAIYIPDSCIKNITIDLNGFGIDRNLKEAVEDGNVIYMDTYGSLTIIDSSEGKTGKITGGNVKSATSYTYGRGGGIFVDYGTLYLKGVAVTGNKAVYGGGVYCDDKDDAVVYIQDGTKIYGNTASVGGGGIYMENGYLYLEDGEIEYNVSANGAGLYWNSANAGYLTGGKISSNQANDKGGGVYVSNYGYIYLGGDILITNNADENLYLGSSYANISNARGQNGAPNKPLTGDARIGISSSKMEEEISEDNSMFDQNDFKFFYPDYDHYYIRTVYDADDEGHDHKLYINTKGHTDGRNPRVKSVSVKNSELVESVEFDYKTQTITLIAHNTKKNFFERASLYNLIDCEYDKDIYSIYGMGEMRDLREVQEYKIISDNGTYVLFTVNVVPSGGEWAANQEDAISYAMTVAHGDVKKEFNNSDEGWAYAVKQKGVPVTVTLFDHWVPTGCTFAGDGAENGYLYMNDSNLDITIDLNGYTIDRGLKSAISNGQVFKIDNGKLTITDSFGTGKITGGNTTGYGGAFWVEYGTLCIRGGEISGNKAEYGGAVYCNDLDDAFIYVEGGKFIGNKATENGGAIYMYDGYLNMTGGEISGNTAKNGAGIYWESDNAAYLTGGSIINNNALVSGGVYVETDGGVYVGGDVLITGNGNGNLYLDGACISNACGQNGAPNKPLSEGARIGIATTDKEKLISADNSWFSEADFDVMFSDNSAYFIRSAYDADDEGHEYKLYINSWGHEDSRYPRVKTVSVKNSDIIDDAVIDYDEQIITLTVSVDNQEALKSAKLESLISYTCDKDTYYIYGADETRDLTLVQKYKTISDNGTYVMVIVEVKWVCSEHTDADNDSVCDNCREYVFSDTAIIDYNAQTQEATVFVIKPGKYTLVFADYENNRLSNVNIVEYEFTEGVNTVPQENKDFVLENGDKVMLWQDMINLDYVCEALTVK